MPERFKVVFTMQGAIQVLGFTSAFYLSLLDRKVSPPFGWYSLRPRRDDQAELSWVVCANTRSDHCQLVIMFAASLPHVRR